MPPPGVRGCAQPQQLTALKNGLQAGRGKSHLFETVAGGWGQGQGAAPRGDYDVKRLCAAPPDSLGKLRADVKADIFDVYGILSSIHGTGGSACESYRQFLGSTIAPLAKIIIEAVAVKLATPALAFTFEDLRAADIASRARAFKQLTSGGMDPASAESIAGLVRCRSHLANAAAAQIATPKKLLGESPDNRRQHDGPSLRAIN